ncbi:MAG: hypothetical protein K0Q49_1326 [Haloplasmataceae bacterium]|jgi:hypothetical protein|nr:hypothetical protein [Haloplasmataceae bacterium]
MTKLITVTELKKVLKQFNNEDLINLILELTKANQFNQELLTAKLSTSNDLIKIKDEYEKKIYKTFYPKAGSVNMNIKDAKSILNNFLIISNDRDLSIDIMVFYVETSLELMGLDMDNISVFKTIIDVFGEIIVNLNKEETNILYNKYKDKLEKVISSAENINWELFDEISNSYCELDWYESDDEEDYK